jgi:hypothetical protein
LTVRRLRGSLLMEITGMLPPPPEIGLIPGDQPRLSAEFIPN